MPPCVGRQGVGSFDEGAFAQLVVTKHVVLHLRERCSATALRVSGHARLARKPRRSRCPPLELARTSGHWPTARAPARPPREGREQVIVDFEKFDLFDVKSRIDRSAEIRVVEGCGLRCHGHQVVVHGCADDTGWCEALH